MNVVSIMAHQDDEMRCLGTMLKCRARGDSLHFITLTDGSGGFVQCPEISRKEAAEIRHREMSAVAAGVGGTFINLREHDEFLYDTPDLIFTHPAADYNQDHTTTHWLVLHCAMHSSLPVLPTASAPLARHPAIFVVPPHGTFEFVPSHFVDITAFETEKARLLALHASQETALQAALNTGFARLVGNPDAYWGDQAGCGYAECFAPMRSRGAQKPHAVLP